MNHLYKNIFLSGVALALISTTVVNAQDLPQPSPAASVTQTIGLTKLTIDYSRPGVNGRVIWGDLVPFDEVWRTGANKANQFILDKEVKISGTAVPAGTYALFTIPGKDKWTVIINKNPEQWGSGDYKMEDDIVRVEVKPTTGEHVERMLFTVDNVTDTEADVTLSWEKVKVSFKVSVETDSYAMANIDEAVKKMDDAFRTYNNAARYYLENGKDVKQALEWAKKSTAISEKFYNVYVLSTAYAANNLMKEAIAAAEKSLKLSTEAKYDKYIKLNTENLAKWKKK